MARKERMVLQSFKTGGASQAPERPRRIKAGIYALNLATKGTEVIRPWLEGTLRSCRPALARRNAEILQTAGGAK